MRKLVLVTIFTMVALSAHSQISRMPNAPLRDEAPSAFKRAQRSLEDVYMMEGMVGIRSAVEQCYRRKPTIATIQYCFALHYIGHIRDEDFAQSSIGQGRRVSYFTKESVYGTAARALRSLGFTQDGATRTLGVWLAASDYAGTHY
jgi:hypothetical protein